MHSIIGLTFGTRMQFPYGSFDTSIHSFLQWVDYAERCLKAAKVLQKLLALSLGLDRDFFDQAGYFDKPTCLLGINRYKFPTKMKNGDPIPPEMYQRWKEGDALGIRPHLDSGIFTFLLTNGVQGLERCVNNQVSPILTKQQNLHKEQYRPFRSTEIL